MKPVEQGFKNYWMYPNDKDEFPYGEGFVEHVTEDDPHKLTKYHFHCEDNFKKHERTKHLYIHTVEIAALKAEQDKVKELVEFIKSISIRELDSINVAKQTALLNKYGASND